MQCVVICALPPWKAWKHGRGLALPWTWKGVQRMTCGLPGLQRMAVSQRIWLTLQYQDLWGVVSLVTWNIWKLRDWPELCEREPILCVPLREWEFNRPLLSSLHHWIIWVDLSFLEGDLIAIVLSANELETGVPMPDVDLGHFLSCLMDHSIPGNANEWCQGCKVKISFQAQKCL